MQAYNVDYGAYEVICREGDPSSDIFYLKSGKLLICTISGTQVKVIARIDPGEFIGELSFFDGKPRASHIVTLEKTTLIQIPRQELTKELPFWYLEAGKNLTKKIRLLDTVLHESNFKKAALEEQKPLPIEEQRKIYSLITQQ
jgi:CRP/FNR family cyclic AMP-dependent transcriptional regulator